MCLRGKLHYMMESLNRKLIILIPVSAVLFVLFFISGPDYHSSRSLQNSWDLGHFLFLAILTYLILSLWKKLAKKSILGQCAWIFVITCRVHDRQHTLGLELYNDRFNRSYPLNPGWNRISINIEDISTAPQTRPMDLSQIQGGWNLCRGAAGAQGNLSGLHPSFKMKDIIKKNGSIHKNKRVQLSRIFASIAGFRASSPVDKLF